MSRLVARLYLGPGPADMVSTGQAGKSGSRDPPPSFPNGLLSVAPAPAHPGLGLPWVLTGPGRAGADTHVQDQGAPGDAVDGLVEQSCRGGQGGDGTDGIRSSWRPQEPALLPDPPRSPARTPTTQAGSAATCSSKVTPGRPDRTAGDTQPWQPGPRPPDAISSRAVPRPALA